MIVAIAFSALLLIALLSILSELVMRIRLSSHELKGEKLLWWRRGADAVASEYHRVFPESFLPTVRLSVFWGFLIIALFLCAAILLKKHMP